jgi:hypothetical protein
MEQPIYLMPFFVPKRIGIVVCCRPDAIIGHFGSIASMLFTHCENPRSKSTAQEGWQHNFSMLVFHALYAQFLSLFTTSAT